MPLHRVVTPRAVFNVKTDDTGVVTRTVAAGPCEYDEFGCYKHLHRWDPRQGWLNPFTARRDSVEALVTHPTALTLKRQPNSQNRAIQIQETDMPRKSEPAQSTETGQKNTAPQTDTPPTPAAETTDRPVADPEPATDQATEPPDESMAPPGSVEPQTRQYSSRGPAINKAMLLGRLTADPDCRFTPDGTPVANLRVATNEREKPEFHQVTAFKQPAEFVRDYLEKGRMVYVEGRMQTQAWTDQNNVTHYTTRVLANQIQAVDSGRQNNAPARGQAQSREETQSAHRQQGRTTDRVEYAQPRPTASAPEQQLTPGRDTPF